MLLKILFKLNKHHQILGQDSKSISPNILFSTVAIADVYEKRVQNSSKRK